MHLYMFFHKGGEDKTGLLQKIGQFFKSDTVKLLNFASNLFSRYSRGRYYRENKSPRKLNTSVIADGTS